MQEYPQSLNDRVMEIKSSAEAKNAFIQEYKPFIASTVEKYTGKYVSYGLDDELSIGLMAFDEAINAYDQSRGSFLSFSRMVIQKRLIDYFRKEKRYQEVVYLSEYSQEDADTDNMYDYVITSEEVKSKYFETEINELRRMELIQLKEELAAWGLGFSDIAKSSPKHASTKQSYMQIVVSIMSDRDLVKRIKQKKYLPVAEIEETTKLPRKTIERARNYIVAAVIILSGDYYCIREFIDWGWRK